MDFDIKLERPKLIEKLKKQTSKSLRPLLKSLGEIAYNRIMENFEKEQEADGTPWAPLAQATIKARQRKHPGKPIHVLQETYNLKKSINVNVKGKSVYVGTKNVKYASVHQYGSEKIPARPYIGISDKEKDNMLDTVVNFLLEL